MLIVVVTLFVHAVRACWRAACGSAGRSRVTGTLAAGAVPRHPARQAAGAIRLEHPDHAGAAGPAAVHPDGRAAVPHPAVAIAVHGPGAVGRRCCRAACCMSTCIGCSIFAAISGSSAATTQVVGRMSLAELLKRGYSKDIADRLARRRRHAGVPDPALQHHDHLRRAGRRLDPEAVHGGLHPGLSAGRLLHGLDHDPHHAASRTLVPEGERKLRARPLARALSAVAQGPGTGRVPDPLRAGLDVWRPCHAVGGGRRRRARRADRGAPAGRDRLSAGARAIGIGVGPDLLDDRADRARRLDPGQRGGLPRHSRGRGRVRHQPAACRRSC